jgi:hypothetical protein
VSADPTEAAGIEATARLLGAYAWVEGRLFEVLGQLAAKGGDVPEVPVLLDAHSQQHAWHASLFSERIPLLPGFEPAALTVSPSPAVGELLEVLERAGNGTDAVALLARVVLPRLVTGYRRHLDRTLAASDAPVARALRLVLRDDIDALLDAEALLEVVLGNGGLLDTVLLRSAEEGLDRAGPGLVPWPD